MHKHDYISFIPGVTAKVQKNSSDLWFIFNKNMLMVKKTDSGFIPPTGEDISPFIDKISNEHYIGELKITNCYCAEIKDIDAIPSDIFTFHDLRTLLPEMDYEYFSLGGKAIQILNWDKEHKFCGKCGSEMLPVKNERAKKCTNCGFINYPRICPAIIVAVTKDDKILLAHNKTFREGLYSCIAGFVDAGETFEECVKREVLEEVGIRVKNINYFTSQPWPFPNSLMIAFTAEYDSGEITVDGVEIEDAQWFSIDTYPILPVEGTVARKLINWFTEKISK